MKATGLRRQAGYLYKKGGWWVGQWRAGIDRKKITAQLGRIEELKEQAARLRMLTLIEETTTQEFFIRSIDQFKPAPIKVTQPSGPISKAKRGAISEMLVAIDLLARGWEVYRNLDQFGGCDLACSLNGRLVRIEVKTIGDVQPGGRIPLDLTAKVGNFDVLAMVLRDGSVKYCAASSLGDFSKPRVPNYWRTDPIQAIDEIGVA